MGWKKQHTVDVTCPSGTVCKVKRMGPELALKAGRIHRLMKKADQFGSTELKEEQGLTFLEALTDKELETLSLFALDVVLATLVSPKLAKNPGPDELGPEDIPLNDFWFLYHVAMGLTREMSVETEGGETTVAAVETFPEGQARDAVPGVDGNEFQGQPC